MSSSPTPAALVPRAPRAVLVVFLFDLCLVAAVGALLAWLAPVAVAETNAAPLVLGPLLALLALFLTISFSLRRLSGWVWVCQLVLLCMVIGVAPFPGLVAVPLLVAWCHPDVRDWFDPPMQREFGRRR